MSFSHELFGKPTASGVNKSPFGNLFGPVGGSRRPIHMQIPPCAHTFNPDYFYFAGRNLPISESTKHCLIPGASGSGKTVAMKLLIQSLIHRVRQPGPPQQLIISDPKCDLIPFLAGLGFHPEDPDVYILNPFDTRSAIWSLNEPMQEPANARYFAEQWVPEEKQSSAPYFADGSRELIIGVVIGLNAGKGKDHWDLRDLLLALSSRENIEAVSSHHPRASELCQRFLSDSKHSDGLISQIGTKMGRFESVAGLWHTSKGAKKFSVKEFLSKPGILVIGNDPVLKGSLIPITSLLIKCLTDEILRESETFAPRHFFILDELRNLGKLSCLHDLLTMGRSKGAAVNIGIQSVEGVIELYGKEAANDILSQCATKVFLRAGGPETAAWAEAHFGKVRHIEKTYSESSTGTDSTSYALQDRPMFLASRFLDMPFPKVGGLYHSISDVPSLRSVFISRRNFSEMLSWIKKPADIPALDKRMVFSDQILLPWTPEERKKFCSDTVPTSESDSKDGKEKNPYLPPRHRKPPEDDPGQGNLFPPGQ